MGSYRIAVLPGDGIGPEVMEAALSVLRALSEPTDGLSLEFTVHQAGAKYFQHAGEVLPDSVLADCFAADAVFLAALGLPEVRNADGTEVQTDMMMRLRREMGLYAAIRPIRLYSGVSTPLKDERGGIDFVIVRENLEGLFASFGGGSKVGDEVATDTMVITRSGTERVVEFAFRLAQRRNGRPLDGRRCVTCVDKANVFRSLAFFRKVFFSVAERHPDIDAEAVYVDAMSLHMVQQPEAFDVLVTENQFGDILSDLGAGLVGGLGMAPSAEIGDEYAMFQPSHGSAPDIAGRDVANPIATILSAAMMLDWLGSRYQDPAVSHARNVLEQAVAGVLAAGSVLPRDLGGDAHTHDVGQAVIREMETVISRNVTHPH